MDVKRLQKIKARVERAVPGPWECGEWGIDKVKMLSPWVGGAWFGDEEAIHNTEFVAHAREDVPALVAEVERLQAENEAMRCDLSDMVGEYRFCDICMQRSGYLDDPPNPICELCEDYDKWEWRGVMVGI